MSVFHVNAFIKQGAVAKAMRKNGGEAVIEVWDFCGVTEKCDEKDRKGLRAQVFTR